MAKPEVISFDHRHHHFVPLSPPLPSLFLVMAITGWSEQSLIRSLAPPL